MHPTSPRLSRRATLASSGLAATTLAFGLGTGAKPAAAATPALTPRLALPHVAPGISITPAPVPPPTTAALSSRTALRNTPAARDTGRIFLVLAPSAGEKLPFLVELAAGSLRPFPDMAWNSWAPGQDPAKAFVHVNAQRIGPDGDLWVVDTGSAGIGAPWLPGGPKIVRIDLATNRVRRSYPMDAALGPKSFLDDLRFHGRNAYVTDAGDPALVVLDLETGATRRLLQNHPSTTATRPLKAEGQVLLGGDGKPLLVHADQLEVSPDGQRLYFQPCCGPMWVVPTAALDDATLSPTALAQQVRPFADTGSTAGTAIDAKGNIYISDTDALAINRISPDGRITRVLQDPRLVWVDAMWIDARHQLWLPASQLNRIAAFQGGASRVQLPVTVYTLPIGAGPAPNDHA